MIEIGAFEAKNKLGSLLDRVESGEEIVITRHEKPVARLIPEGSPSLNQVLEAAAELDALRAEMKKFRPRKAISAKEIRRAIAEGRH